MRRLLTLFLTISSCLVAWGQSAVVSGRFFDAETKEGIAGAIIEVVSQRDTLYRRHTTTGYGGYFKTSSLPRGEYKLSFTFLGYQEYERKFKVDALPINIGDMAVSQAAINVGVVVKTVVVPRAQIMGDTLKYSANQFKVTADAELESLLRKMPGISINNGRIEAQGEVVKQIYVDGKEFFGGSVQQALQSIPAQAVESIEVYNRLSETSQATGVDDGNGGKVINIITKSSLSRSEFGKMHASGGVGYDRTPEPLQLDSEGNPVSLNKSEYQNILKAKYSVGGSMNIFRDDMRISIMALANNLNRKNLSDEGISMSGSTNRSRGSASFSVNSQSGVTANEIFAINYADRWGKRKRAKFDGNISFNHNNSQNQYTVDRWYNAPSKIDTIHYDQYSNPNNLSLSLRGRLTWKVAKRQSLYLNPTYRYTNNFSINQQDTTTMRLPGSESGRRYYPSYNEGRSRSHNAGLSGHYSYRFLRQGRALVISASASHNQSDSWRHYNSYSGSQHIDSLRKYSFSHNTTKNKTSTFNIHPTYRDKIGRRTVINLAYNFQYQMRDRTVMNYTTDETYEMLPEKLKQKSSSEYEGLYMFHEASAGIRYGRGKNWFSLNLKYRNTTLSNTNLWEEEKRPLARTYNNFLYNITFNLSSKRKHSMRMAFNSQMRVPGMWSLTEMYDANNTSYISVGNPNLKPAQEHSGFIRYTNVSPRFGTTFMVMAKAMHVTNFVGSKIAYEPGKIKLLDYIKNDGSEHYATYNPLQLSQQVNLDGYWSYEFRTSLGLPLKHLRSNVNFVLGATYTDTPTEIINMEKLNAEKISVIDENGKFSVRGDKVMMHGTNAYAQVTLGSNISENVDFTITWRGQYSYNSSSFAMADNQYFMHYLRGNIKAVLPLGFTITSALNFTNFIAITNKFNDHFTLWNISLGKKVLNSLGEVELCVNDVLNQNTSFSRYVIANYSQLRYNSVIGRTFLVRFTYNLRNLGGQKRRMKMFDGPQDRLADIQDKLDALKF